MPLPLLAASKPHDIIRLALLLIELMVLMSTGLAIHSLAWHTCHATVPVSSAIAQAGKHVVVPRAQASVVRNAIGSPRKTTAVVRNLEAAMAAARDGVAREGRRLGPGGTGECLRSNFALLCNTVLEQDGHLLTNEEHRLLRAFQVLTLFREDDVPSCTSMTNPTSIVTSISYHPANPDTFTGRGSQPHFRCRQLLTNQPPVKWNECTQELPIPPQCLFLRLLQRRGPLFRLAGLTYADVGDARSATAHLENLGVAHLIDASDDWEPFIQVQCFVCHR